MLRNRYPSEPTEKLAKVLNRSVSSLYHKAHRLGIHRANNLKLDIPPHLVEDYRTLMRNNYRRAEALAFLGIDDGST